MPKYILLTFFLALCAITLQAQNQWKPKGTLYSDKNIHIEIEYLLSPDGCTGQSSYFRYRITRIKPIRDYYINWRFDFFNCDNELKTQINSLHILKKTKTGIITPKENSFTFKKMSNYYNDVKVSNDLPDIGSYQPKAAFSMEPIAINGKTDIQSGDSTILTLKGGYLGTGASWMWYDGACNGALLGKGTSLKLSPDRTTTVFVRASTPESSSCISTEIRVKQGSLAPKAILGRSIICEGEQNITLSVSGGKLFGQAKWIWYAGSCSGNKIGEGSSINVSPERTTTYFIRAENGNDQTVCQSFQIVVNNKSNIPNGIEGTQSISYGAESVLKIVGGYLAPGAQWVWYKGSKTALQQVATGAVLSTGPLYADEVFSVRAEGDCNQTAFISRIISVSNKPYQDPINRSGKTSFIVNGGVVFTEPSNVGKSDNYVLTIGSGGRIGWFASVKLSSKNNTTAAFQTNNISLTDYNMAGYYSYNGEVINKRSAYTAGIFLGGYKVSAYLGGGYGTRTLLWGIDQYQYGNNGSYAKSYALHTGESYKGAELELGLMLRLGFFNLMGGASSLQFKYTDFNIGVGFNL
ncbi:hypothetical protein G6M26_20455 [Agrobacterium tumefaciens]|nr:hypothetical protein [Agrobacterium tumefaciens]NTE20911.1 hypothetical protein [Agrobacterium tumefaciens]